MSTATTTRRHTPSTCPQDDTCHTCVACYRTFGGTRCGGCCPHAEVNYPDDDAPAKPVVVQLRMTVALLRAAQAAMRFHYQKTPSLEPEWRELSDSQRNYWLNLARDAVVAWGVEQDEPLPVRGAELTTIFAERADELLRYIAQGHVWMDERARIIDLLQHTFADGQRDEAAARR